MRRAGGLPAGGVKQILKDEVVAVLGYGVQGRGQSLNMKDNGVKVIIGLRDRARRLGPGLAGRLGAGQDAVPLEEAAARGTIIQYLLSDAGQKEHVAERSSRT